jgi:predicted cupin superfamily sugar epimerase
LWIYQAGTPPTLRVADEAGTRAIVIGVDAAAGQQPQHVVPPGQWQAAEAGEGWCLVACVVVPGFEFAGFELAPPGWAPPG